jgi:hypothetical protein
VDDPEPARLGRGGARRPDDALSGCLLRSAVDAPSGVFRVTADSATVQGPPAGEIPRRLSPFRDDGPPRTGTVRDECTITLDGPDDWLVTTVRGEYRRAGGRLVLGYPGHAAHEIDVENVRARTAEWPYYAGQWAEELVLPHRLLGLLDGLVVVDPDPDRPRLRAAVSLRQPEAYDGIAGEEVLEVEFAVDPARGVVVGAVATTWDRRVSTYTLEVLG